MRRWTRPFAALLAPLVAVAVLGTATPAGAATAETATIGPAFYLALGDSLAAGVQPDPVTGENELTSEGYVDQLYGALRLAVPQLQLTNLACPLVETTEAMIEGGACPYQAGSQLRQAEQFLRAHRESVGLVTIDIGANDYLACDDLPPAEQPACVGAVIVRAGEIAARLRAAAGPSVQVIGMTYYNPLLAQWFVDPALARAAVIQGRAANRALAAAYRQAGIDVADVESAFQTRSFRPVPTPQGTLPLNVAVLCALTHMCGPHQNIHANRLGYLVIAATFLSEIDVPKRYLPRLDLPVLAAMR